MNHGRIAALLREQARIASELADEFASDAEAPPPAPRSRPKKRTPDYPAPLHPPSDVDRMRAKKMLRRKGIYT